jgi:amidohydrolase
VETLAPKLKEAAEQVVLDRRHLHMHPELGFQEVETARFVAERLRSLGLEVRTGIAQTGVLGLLRGTGGGRAGARGKTVLLRADMDALPIEEENEVGYRSTRPGVMHACGHDGHTAILLGAARVLAERRDRLAGTVKFLFQPCEEKPPGGAIRMIEEGVLEGPGVDAAFGLHLAQELPVGMVSARPGPIMAAADMFRLEIVGRGGHAARPHECVDAGLVAAQVMVALHSIVAREVNPIEPAVITVGVIQAGTAPNVIPDRALLRGTVRAFDQKLRERLARRVEEVAVGVARAMRAECACSYEWGYPAVVNEPSMTEFVSQVAQEVVGPERLAAREPSMGGEDFAYFLQKVPGCFFNVGTRNEELGLVWGHHHPRFDIDEAALPVGIDMFVRLVEKYLAP